MQRLYATAAAQGPGSIRNPYFGSDQPIDRETSPEPESALTIDPFIGRRLWSIAPGTLVGDRPERPVLRSATRSTTWDGPGMTASCLTRRADEPRRHPTVAVPAQQCVCGIYALKQPAPPPRPWTWALGTIALSGKVLEGTLGYRAERGRIVGPLRLSLGGEQPTCLEAGCRRPADWMRIGPRLYLPRCSRHLRPESNGMVDLPLEEFLGHAAEGLGERYGVGLEGA